MVTYPLLTAMIFVVKASLNPEVVCCLLFPVEEFLFYAFARMPVYCIVCSCDNDQHNASLGILYNRQFYPNQRKIKFWFSILLNSKFIFMYYKLCVCTHMYVWMYACM